MEKVYVVIDYLYEDYEVKAVFSSIEKVREYFDVKDADEDGYFDCDEPNTYIEEFILDDASKLPKRDDRDIKILQLEDLVEDLRDELESLQEHLESLEGELFEQKANNKYYQERLDKLKEENERLRSQQTTNREVVLKINDEVFAKAVIDEMNKVKAMGGTPIIEL